MIDVGNWSAKLELGGDGSGRLEVEADSGSLRVEQGTGGVMELTEDDKREIAQTIDDEVLGRKPIRFASSALETTEDGRHLRISGDLELVDQTRPVEFDLRVNGDDGITGSATVKQSEWGIKPYTALFGALKVRDEVEIVVESKPPA